MAGKYAELKHQYNTVLEAKLSEIRDLENKIKMLRDVIAAQAISAYEAEICADELAACRK